MQARLETRAMERAVPHRASESHVSTPLLNVGHNDGLRTDGVVDETTRSSIVVSDGFAHCFVATIECGPWDEMSLGLLLRVPTHHPWVCARELSRNSFSTLISYTS
jgi:hypothetical protein